MVDFHTSRRVCACKSGLSQSEFDKTPKKADQHGTHQARRDRSEGRKGSSPKTICDEAVFLEYSLKRLEDVDGVASWLADLGFVVGSVVVFRLGRSRTVRPPPPAWRLCDGAVGTAVHTVEWWPYTVAMAI